MSDIRDDELRAYVEEERELFGDKARPSRPALDKEGDFIQGLFVSLERGVDLKTGYEPVDILIIEGVSGLLAGRTERVVRGLYYAWAIMHVTAKNQVAALDPEPSAGERIAIRRGRQFVSNVDGPGKGKELTAWDVVMPDRKF